MKYIVFIVVASLFCSCVYDPATGILTVNNHSDSTMYIYCSCSDSIAKDPELKLYFPVGKFAPRDINGNAAYNDTIIYPRSRVKAHEATLLNGFGTLKKPRISCGKSDSIKLFFIYESTLKSKRWKQIYEQQLFVKKMSFSNRQLDSLNWNIIFKLK